MSSSLDGLSAAFDEVFRDLREKFREASKEAKMWESLQAFAAAVDWTEPWIICLLATHLLLFIMVLVFRRSWNLNLLIMVSAAAVVYNAQRINTNLQAHWKAFARQPYFDDQGIFISALVSAPLLLIMLVQVVRFLEGTQVSHLHFLHVMDSGSKDEQGAYISALVSAPLLITMPMQLVSYLILTSQMLVEMKVKELKYKARQRALQQKRSGQESKKNS